MTSCFFVADLHGHIDRYEKLFHTVLAELPRAVFLGGDLLPHGLAVQSHRPDFVNDYLIAGFARLREAMQEAYPRVFVILGNDDGRLPEEAFFDAAAHAIWEYIPDRRVQWGELSVFGYAYSPPTPFRLKDWEKYDVSRSVHPGCISPEEGFYSVPISNYAKSHSTIERDLERLAAQDNLEHAIFLFHTPPYQCHLDRIALHTPSLHHAPLEAHVGSIAVKHFIEARQPLITLHGHIHESARITGKWKEQFGRTHAFSAAHDGPELALVRFSPEDPASATRVLL